MQSTSDFPRDLFAGPGIPIPDHDCSLLQWCGDAGLYDSEVAGITLPRAGERGQFSGNRTDRFGDLAAFGTVSAVVSVFSDQTFADSTTE
jgi:hypothetical protein